MYLVILEVSPERNAIFPRTRRHIAADEFGVIQRSTRIFPVHRLGATETFGRSYEYLCQ